MSKNKKKVIQFETDEFYRYTVDLLFYNMGIDEPDKVTSPEETRKVVGDIENKKVIPDVAIIDTFIGINNEDGQKIAEKIRKASPKTKIIGYSIIDTSEWADFHAQKSTSDGENTLVKIMEEVMGVEFQGSNVEDPEFQAF